MMKDVIRVDHDDREWGHTWFIPNIIEEKDYKDILGCYKDEKISDRMLLKAMRMFIERNW